MALILCTGADRRLLTTRQLILERSGHRVMTAVNEQELIEHCHDYTFDLAVIGQSLGPKMKLHAMDLLREHCPSVKILELYSPYAERALKDADAWMEMPTNGPQDFERVVRALTAPRAAATA
jgi:ActR/RegA family two-component response regulator